MNAIGYDRDIAELVDGPLGAARGGSWRAVWLDRAAGLLTVPAGTALDLGATAKAWTADHAAAALSARYGTAVLVELGGDLAVAGDRPGGWCVQVAESEGAPGQLVLVRSGGLATSTTTVRAWRRAGQPMHHLVDPATGRPTAGPWRTASVAATSALAANVASTAAIVRGADALDRLTRRGEAARLIARDGTVTATPGWPRTFPRFPANDRSGAPEPASSGEERRGKLTGVTR
jgi:thiamine biosynthesis lipoprotein